MMCVSGAENHDTGSTLNHWPFPWNHVHEGYAYILTHPGSPCVFYDHFWDDSLGKTIRDCIDLRRRHKIGCRAKVLSSACWTSMSHASQSCCSILKHCTLADEWSGIGSRTRLHVQCWCALCINTRGQVRVDARSVFALSCPCTFLSLT